MVREIGLVVWPVTARSAATGESAVIARAEAVGRTEATVRSEVAVRSAATGRTAPTVRSAVTGQAPIGRDAPRGRLRVPPGGPVTTGHLGNQTAGLAPIVTSAGRRAPRAADGPGPIRPLLPTTRSAWTCQKASRQTS
jgi:hypothetical protein